MIKEVEGIVLSNTPFKESSKIINVYTKEYGVIGILCKGVQSTKSKLRGITDKLTYAKFNIYYKEGKLSTLVDASIINPFKNIKKDIISISYATYICDLVSQVIKQTDDIDIYNDLINSLIKIDDGLDPMIITNIIEVKLLKYLGVGLNFTSCAICGNKKDIVTLSEKKGGLLCKNCYTDEKLIPLDVVKILNIYFLVDIKSINKLSIDKKIASEINRFLTSYYDDNTGLYLKSKDFLKTIEKL